jgi:hypothetical protein
VFYAPGCRGTRALPGKEATQALEYLMLEEGNAWDQRIAASVVKIWKDKGIV